MDEQLKVKRRFVTFEPPGTIVPETSGRAAGRPPGAASATRTQAGKPGACGAEALPTNMRSNG